MSAGRQWSAIGTESSISGESGILTRANRLGRARKWIKEFFWKTVKHLNPADVKRLRLGRWKGCVHGSGQ